MAEHPWRDNSKAAVAVLFAGTGGLALLDAATRPGSTPAVMVVTGIALLVAAAGSLFVEWSSLPELVRLAPAGIVLVALLVVVLAGDLGESAASPVGLTITAVLLMLYVGLVSPPGRALALAPLLLVVLLLAYWKEPDRLHLALPLLAVPVAALLAELVASLIAGWNTSRDAAAHTAERLLEMQRLLPRFTPDDSISEAAAEIGLVGRQVFGARRSTVVLRDRNDRLVTATDGPFDLDLDLRVAGMLAEAIGGDEPRIVGRDETDDTFLVIPLPSEGAPVGAVVLHPVAGDHDSLYAMAELFAAQIGASIEHLHLIDELAEATRLDELTGIGNRRHADDLLESMTTGDALILIDVDGFKRVNDTYGHPVGDQLLQTLSAHLRACLRDSDTSARLGGDEFLVVARRAHADPLAVAHRILDGWDERRQSIGEVTPTLSAGVALHDAHRSSAETYYRADRALLQAKRMGKNQAQLWVPTNTG